MTGQNIEAKLSASGLSEEMLRQFACVCCEVVFEKFHEPLLRELVDVGYRRSRGTATTAEIDLIRKKADELNRSLYPGFDDPSPPALALCAAGETALTENALTAALHASEFAAWAVAKQVAESSADEEYDRILDSTFERICQEQVRLLDEFSNRAR